MLTSKRSESVAIEVVNLHLPLICNHSPCRLLSSRSRRAGGGWLFWQRVVLLSCKQNEQHIFTLHAPACRHATDLPLHSNCAHCTRAALTLLQQQARPKLRHSADVTVAHRTPRALPAPHTLSQQPSAVLPQPPPRQHCVVPQARAHTRHTRTQHTAVPSRRTPLCLLQCYPGI